MIYRSQDSVTITCDLCRDETQHDVRSNAEFQSLWLRLQRNGWRAQKIDDNSWEHACPACVEKHLTKPKLVLVN